MDAIAMVIFDFDAHIGWIRRWKELSCKVGAK
jgi:hypothetical protein